MALKDLRGRDRQRADTALAWAQGQLQLPDFPDPRELCSWLVDVVRREGREGGDPERGWQACCELVQIAAGLRVARADPAVGSLARHPLVRFAVDHLELTI